HVVVVLTRRPRRSSTLFPYTTLFRSEKAPAFRVFGGGEDAPAGAADLALLLFLVHRRALVVPVEIGEFPGPRKGVGHDGPAGRAAQQAIAVLVADGIAKPQRDKTGAAKRRSFRRLCVMAPFFRHGRRKPRVPRRPCAT